MELVAEKTGVALNPKFASAAVVREDGHHTVPAICDDRIAWRHSTDVEAGDLEHGLVELRAGNPSETRPRRE